jgi:hypothetical protein
MGLVRKTVDGVSEIGPLDEIDSALDDAVSIFIAVTRRLHLIDRFQSEYTKVSGAVRAADQQRPENDALWQVLNDCYAMLIIDLASAREGILEKQGLLNAIRRRPERILRASPEEFEPRKGAGDPQALAEMDEYERRQIAASVNSSIEWLFGSNFPLTAGAVEELIKRFFKDTEAIDNDRSHVRAHRYEYRQADRFRYALPLKDLKIHIAAFEEYLRHLYHAVTRKHLYFKLKFWGEKTAAEDLADLVVCNGIDGAADVFGLISSPTGPWYWTVREGFLSRYPTPPTAED